MIRGIRGLCGIAAIDEQILVYLSDVYSTDSTKIGTVRIFYTNKN